MILSLCRIRLSFFPALSFSVWRFLSSLSVDVRTPSKQTELTKVRDAGKLFQIWRSFFFRLSRFRDVSMYRLRVVYIVLNREIKTKDNGEVQMQEIKEKEGN